MKKLLFLAAVASLGLCVACDSSDNDGETTTFDYLQSDFTLQLSDDLFALVNLTITYDDPAVEGDGETDTLTAVKWNKSFKTTSFPASYSFKIEAALKEGVTLDKSNYALSYEVTTLFEEYRSNGKVKWKEGPDSERQAVVLQPDAANPDQLKTKIEEFITNMNLLLVYTIRQEADGGFDVEDNI